MMALGDTHHPTPKKAEMLAVANYLQMHKIRFFRADIYRFFNFGARL